MKTALLFLTILFITSGCVPKSELEKALVQLKEKEAALVALSTQQEAEAKRVTALERNLADAVARETAAAAKADGEIARLQKELESNKVELQKEKLRKDWLEETLRKLGVQLSASHRELRKLSSSFEEGISGSDFAALHRAAKISIENILESGPKSNVADAIQSTLDIYTELRKVFDKRLRAVDEATEAADRDLRTYASWTTASNLRSYRDRLEASITELRESFDPRIQALMSAGATSVEKLKSLSESMDASLTKFNET